MTLAQFNKALIALCDAKTDEEFNSLDFGDGKRIKKIKVAKWDIARKTIDNHTIVPKL